MKRPAVLGFPTRRISLAAGVAALLGGACTEEPVTVPLRSMQSSGPMSFVCLSAPSDDPASFALPLDACSAAASAGIADYSIPHLYALVTQPIAGEVAVVDLTTDEDAVLDQDAAVPGASFLPVGASPTDIVSTPASMASFVGSAEPGFEGLYAISSSMIRGAAPRLSSWPGCALPVAPGAIVLAVDPPDDDGLLRPTCDSAYGADDPVSCSDGAGHCRGDLGLDAEAAGQPGRYKLVVALPAAGGIAILDAQELLDRPAGAWEPCQVERWVPLESTAPLPPAAELPEPIGCVNERRADAGPHVTAFDPEPGDMVLDGSALLVADNAGPLVHRFDLSSPCEPLERPGLLATSAEDPERIVRVGALGLSPLTSELRRFLYAVDVADGSVMVFDVSEGATSVTPISRSHPELNPYQPADRIRFQSPPRTLVSFEHLNDAPDAVTGAGVPIRCDPDPDSTGPGTAYRTSTGYDSGASPSVLRGVFTFIVLASGDVVAIDVDDYDAPCRGPVDQDELFGCSTPLEQDRVTSGEYSCRTVLPHAPRASGFQIHAPGIATTRPGLQSEPLLLDETGAVVRLDEETPESLAAPRLRATIPLELPPAFDLVVGGELQELDPATGQLRLPNGDPAPNAHALVMNLEEPRAHLVVQSWSVSYEGSIPGFGGLYAQLAEDGEAGSHRLEEPSARFCERGLMSARAVAEGLEAQGLAAAEAASEAQDLADFVVIGSATPVQEDAYWEEQSSCSFTSCRNTYGTPELPTVRRELRIVEAYQGTLLLEPRTGLEAPVDAELKCCFPASISFGVRAGRQWVVLGSNVGFMHHVVADPETGVCRPSCAPEHARENGRAADVASGTVVADGAPEAFINSFFRFAIERGLECDEPESCHDTPPVRDMQFQFSTSGSFAPISLSVVTSNLDVQPQSVEYLAPTGELVVSDGSLEGITLLNLDLLAVTRQFY